MRTGYKERDFSLIWRAFHSAVSFSELTGIDFTGSGAAEFVFATSASAGWELPAPVRVLSRRRRTSDIGTKRRLLPDSERERSLLNEGRELFKAISHWSKKERGGCQNGGVPVTGESRQKQVAHGVHRPTVVKVALGFLEIKVKL